VYATKLIRNDIRFVQKLASSGHTLKILSLEREYQTSLGMTIDGKPQVVFIRGKIDRIDQAGPLIRIIDYKSGVRSSDKFAFNGFGPLFEDNAYNKQLQLIMYAWLLHRNNLFDPARMRPCIIPFREFREEPIQLLDGKQPLQITAGFLAEFELSLIAFIERIFDRDQPFAQTDDAEACKFCSYNVICARQQVAER
jgi:ATP-dependent helicase/nuclease subunit B